MRRKRIPEANEEKTEIILIRKEAWFGITSERNRKPVIENLLLKNIDISYTLASRSRWDRILGSWIDKNVKQLKLT
jgi:hypothetical protein